MICRVEPATILSVMTLSSDGGLIPLASYCVNSRLALRHKGHIPDGFICLAGLLDALQTPTIRKAIYCLLL